MIKIQNTIYKIQNTIIKWLNKEVKSQMSKVTRQKLAHLGGRESQIHMLKVKTKCLSVMKHLRRRSLFRAILM